MTYVLAMTLYPQWQTRLQEEVDRVCGERMPYPSDSPDMPALRAGMKVIMRWRPVTPSSIPHESIEDDVYEGYSIPKGLSELTLHLDLTLIWVQVHTSIRLNGQSPATRRSIQILDFQSSLLARAAVSSSISSTIDNVSEHKEF